MKFLFILLFFSFGSVNAGQWQIDFSLKFEDAIIRTGIRHADSLRPKAHILYLQGLGDSMMNHEPLFQYLNAHGYSVIAFDYMEQGKSTGSMNNTSIAKINKMADQVWKMYVSRVNTKKILLGWSTGGLAAYRYAYKYPAQTKAVILMAPGIVPKRKVGETDLRQILMNPIKCITGEIDCKIFEITEASLTQNLYVGKPNPHIDPIHPKSPLAVPKFAFNLLYTSQLSRYWNISEQVQGLVYLSDDVDSYVDREATMNVIQDNAKHFTIIDYNGTGALHELDNEIESVSKHLRRSMLYFLDRLSY